MSEEDGKERGRGSCWIKLYHIWFKCLMDREASDEPNQTTTTSAEGGGEGKGEKVKSSALERHILNWGEKQNRESIYTYISIHRKDRVLLLKRNPVQIFKEASAKNWKTVTISNVMERFTRQEIFRWLCNVLTTEGINYLYDWKAAVCLIFMLHLISDAHNFTWKWLMLKYV